MVLTVYFFLCRLLQFSFKNVSSFEKFKTGRTLRRKNSIILTPRSSTFLLRNTKPGGGVLPYMGYIGMCRCEGYGFQAVYFGIGFIGLE